MAHEGLNLDRGLTTPQIRIVAARELFDHRLVHVSLDIVVGKKLERQADGLRIATGLDQGRDRVIAHVNVQKFINVRDPNPIGIDHAVLFARVF